MSGRVKPISELPQTVKLLDGRIATKRFDTEVDSYMYFDENDKPIDVSEVDDALEPPDPAEIARRRWAASHFLKDDEGCGE